MPSGLPSASSDATRADHGVTSTVQACVSRKRDTVARFLQYRALLFYFSLALTLLLPFQIKHEDFMEGINVVSAKKKGSLDYYA